MSEKWMGQAVVLRKEWLAEGIVSLLLSTDRIAAGARAGQFLSLYCKDGSRMLPRPISICEIDKSAGTVRLVFRIAGAGTKEFAGYEPGEHVKVTGPLGNGFPQEAKKAILIGGGIGIPPMLELAKELDCEKQVVLGYRDSAMFLREEFLPWGEVYVATEDGSFGTKGTVLDAIEANRLLADVIYACGPTPMLRALKQYAKEKCIPCWISLEERMACGIGACLACVCRTAETDKHTNVKNKRICKEGPVFLAEDVEL